MSTRRLGDALKFPVATSTNASANIPATTVDPTSPKDGDIWYKSGLIYYRSGSTSLNLVTSGSNSLPSLIEFGSLYTDDTTFNIAGGNTTSGNTKVVNIAGGSTSGNVVVSLGSSTTGYSRVRILTGDSGFTGITSSNAPFQIGSASTLSQNLVITNDLIQARTGTSATSLSLQTYGGYVFVGPGGLQSSGSIDTTFGASISSSGNLSASGNITSGTFMSAGTSVAAVNSIYTGGSSTSSAVTTVRALLDSEGIIWGCRNSGASLFLQRTGTLNGTVASFLRGGGGSVGSIEITGTNSTAFNTSSDYRIKENVVDIEDGIDVVSQLKPRLFNFIEEKNITRSGFIAHEVQEVIPQAVSGEKDAVDDDGNPIYQGIDHSTMVPYLTAALQQAINRIENLTQRLEAAGL